MVRFRMMTFRTPLPRKKPPPTMWPPVPTPTIVLLELTRSSVPRGLMVMAPDTRMTCGALAVTYWLSCAWVVTVTV